MCQRFNNRTVVITGAGGYLGVATAIRFYNEGARLVLNDMVETKLTEMLHLMPENHRVATVVADVSKYKEAHNVIEEGLKRFGQIDVLVNLAGGGLGHWITEMTEEDWDYFITLNLKSAFNCIKAVVPHFLTRKMGKIINVSSLAKDGVPWFAQARIGRSNYAAAKAGLIGLTRTLAQELGPEGITINCVVPGPVMTPRYQERFLERLENDPNVPCSPLRTIPLRRLATPEDVAGAICFLASDDADYISGHALYVTGGL